MNSENLYILIIAGLTIAVMAVLLTLFSVMKRKARNKKYCELVTAGYAEKGVLNALILTRDTFSKRSAEYIILDKAVFYLTMSCLRDYQSAFAMIEDIFSGKDVENLHDRILNTEKNKMILLIEKQGGYTYE